MTHQVPLRRHAGRIPQWRVAPSGGSGDRMDALTAFGLFAVTFMLVCYVLEDRAPFWTLLFALGCLMGSAYGFLQGAWPFGAVELIWFVVALRRWVGLRSRARGAAEPIA